MKIVLLESLGVTQEVMQSYVAKMNAEGHTVECYARDLNEEVQIERAKDADILVIANMPLSGKVIRACKNLKYIDVAFTGVDHVDLEAAKERGIAVSNASGYSTESVAELTICMMLSLLRNVSQVEKKCREGGTKDGLVGSELRGKVVGIIGTGAIGRRVADLCHCFGCEVIGYSRHPKKDLPDYIRDVSLEELLSQSDIVSLHCPLNEDSRHLINESRIQLMKNSALLINAARGPVVDSAALARALNDGRIAGAGIDVFEMEPPVPQDHPLLNAKNTLLTPHVAFASKESMELRAEIVFDNIEKWVGGEQTNIVL